MMRTNISTPLDTENDLNSKATIIISCICHMHSRTCRLTPHFVRPTCYERDDVHASAQISFTYNRGQNFISNYGS